MLVQLSPLRPEIAALGFTGQPYAVAFQIDRATGELHVHAGISRIARRAGGRLFAIDPGLYKNRLKEISRACERDYGLTIVSSERKPGDRAHAAGRNEFEESRRLGTDVRAIRNAILDCSETSDSGRALKAALDAQGFELATGDRRDCFVVVDQAAGHHALTKKLTGLTLAQIRQRLRDLDRAQLPSVDQAKIRQRARLAQDTAAESSSRFFPRGSDGGKARAKGRRDAGGLGGIISTRTSDTRTHGAADQGAAAVSAIGSITDQPHPQPMAWSSGSDHARTGAGNGIAAPPGCRCRMAWRRQGSTAARVNGSQYGQLLHNFSGGAGSSNGSEMAYSFGIFRAATSSDWGCNGAKPLAK